jgi:NADH-quinone oxidoreductase subunit M
MSHILSLIIFLPFACSIFLILIPRRHEKFIKNFSFVFSLFIFFISLLLFYKFDKNNALFQFEEGPFYWITNLNISYHIGIDGISLFLVLLTTFLTPLVILGSYSNIKNSVKEYNIIMLILETALLGVFSSIDLFLFYVFWEIVLIPMYFIIGIWGHERKIYATIKFFIYTMVGSLFMLLAIIYLGFIHEAQFGKFSIDFTNLLNLNLDFKTQIICFLAFFIAFAIKVPVFPFHTWLPDAHVEAPTGGSVILAGILLKMGTYGFIRFLLPLFPHATSFFTPFILILSIIGIIYGALLALAQDNLKKLVAYSSISHLGYVMFGLFAGTATSIAGGIYQMLNHGISTGALFLIVGILYERRHTLEISEYGGISKRMPIFAAIFMIVSLSSIGLPLTNGFVGEFLILSGSFVSNISNIKFFTILASFGIVLGACYMLWMLERVIFGPIKSKLNETLIDINSREKFVLIFLVAFIILMGTYTKPFLSRMDVTIKYYLTRYNGSVN